MDIFNYLEKYAIATPSQVKDILSNKKSHYYVHTIMQGKKERVISCPDEELKALQLALKKFYMVPPISKAVAAYEKGCSVAGNAMRHSYGKHVLHADIKSFFPSINKKLFMAEYKKHYNESNATLLWDIASLEGGLPVGSCVSPFIANRVMYTLDKKLKRIKFGIKYSRYADDMVFSHKKVLNKELIDKISAILLEYGLKLNDKKTYFMTARKQVNGLLLHGGRLSLGTNFKKQLKQQVYNLLVNKKGNFKSIVGKLAYLKSIEPQYAQVVLRKYGELDSIGLFARSGYDVAPKIQCYNSGSKII